VVLRSGGFVLPMARLCLSQKLCQRRDVQAEAASGKTGSDLLHQPAVTVRITERGEGAVAAVLGIRPHDPHPPKYVRLVAAGVLGAAVEHLADLDAASEKLNAGCVDVGDGLGVGAARLVTVTVGICS